MNKKYGADQNKKVTSRFTKVRAITPQIPKIINTGSARKIKVIVKLEKRKNGNDIIYWNRYYKLYSSVAI